VTEAIVSCSWWVRTLSISALAGALADCSSTSGATRQYSGTPVNPPPAVVTRSGSVKITNVNGSIWVDTASVTGFVTVTGRPFATGADDDAARQAAIAAMASLHLDVSTDSTGVVTVAGDGDDTRGFDLTVHLPYPFGGLVNVTSGNGYVHYVGSSGSTGCTINVTKGDVFVQDGGKFLNITGGTSNISVITLPTLVGTSITTKVGNINAQIPQAAVLLVTATTAGGGTVTPPPDKAVELNLDPSSGDTTDMTGDDGGFAGQAISNVAPDHKSATIQMGALAVIQQNNWYLTVSTGNGNIVFH
jgi:hypothetical protein